MIEIQAPHPYDMHIGKIPAVFLAGTIDNGAGVQWQRQVVEELADIDVLFLNPRRKDWNAKADPVAENPHFREQVEWELDALDAADLIVIYFAPGSLSPVTMLELGIHAVKHPEKLIVCCADGFWRKGNVDIVCERYGVRRAKNLENLIDMINAETTAIALFK